MQQNPGMMQPQPGQGQMGVSTATNQQTRMLYASQPMQVSHG